jgi:carboxyl-terminal processing protease
MGHNKRNSFARNQESSDMSHLTKASCRRLAWRAPLLAAVLTGAVFAQPARAAPQDAETYRQLDQLMEVFERIRSEYVEKVDDKVVLEGAINGMLAALDPHSSFLNARDFESMRVTTDGEYGGLGLEVTEEDGVIKIVSPMDDTPAARAGLKSGDFITHINKEPVFGLTVSDAVNKMRGPAKTSINLTIVRPNQTKPFDVTLVREVITLKPVRFEAKNDVGYIRISTFNKQTGSMLRGAIDSLERQIGPRMTGFVLDLRRNPGGLLDQAIEVTDAFLERGEIVSQRGRRKDDIQRYYARPGDLTEGRPIIVLINEGSASASEIVAGALQDHRRALILGMRSFGKGSVQTLIPMTQNTALRLTTARYYTPSGNAVQEEGIEPDIVVRDPSESNDKLPALREADLRNHLLNDAKAGAQAEELDNKKDSRLDTLVASAEKAKVEDFQLDYALRILKHLSKPGGKVAMN